MRAGRASARFHDGELAVQRRAGVEKAAATVGAVILPALRIDHAEFLARQRLLVVAGTDADGRVWASPLAGAEGFVVVQGERRLLLRAPLAPADPLQSALTSGATPVGLLALDPATRRRIRVNGRAQQTAAGIAVTVDEAFGNCPQYIHRRQAPTGGGPREPAGWRDGTVLDARQRGMVGAADTFFICSNHPERGADASHRGGPPGFVEVDPEGRSLRFPDYPGNRMFQTLGNLAVDPRAGLLFLDWDTGTALQLSGTARTVWDSDELGAWPGAQRLIDFAVTAVHEQECAVPAPWERLESARDHLRG